MTLGAGVSPVSHKQPLPLKPSFSSRCKIECFYACPVFLWRDASGIKLKKKVIDGSTITTTEYMDGFQYTNNTLDFFPHTSTALSAGSEGYVKALAAGLGGGRSYDFKYVFTYTDHTSAALSTGLGNIRLKYAQDPSNNNPASVLPRLRERTGGGIRNTISYNSTLKLVPKLLKQSF